MRGGPTCGEDPPDDIPRVVNAERLTNGSRWIEIGERSRRVPLHCVEHAACIVRPADGRPVGVDCLREADVTSEVDERLHASIGAPNKGSRCEEIAAEPVSDDHAGLIDAVCQRRGKAGERPETSELVIFTPAYGCPATDGLVPTCGNTGVVDCTRLTGERVARYGQRLHGVGVGAVGG